MAEAFYWVSKRPKGNFILHMGTLNPHIFEWSFATECLHRANGSRSLSSLVMLFCCISLDDV